MNINSNSDLIPLLIPEVPSAYDLLPWLERIDISKSYTNFGCLVVELEKAFSEKFQVDIDNVTTVANATLGLELALQALSLPKKAKVLIPNLTFVATATAVIRAGYEPVLADVDIKSWLLTPEIAIEALNSIDISAVIPVATFGLAQQMKAWCDFEKETGIPVVVDAAGAYGSQWLDGMHGTLVFSLHATKNLPAGEGGLVVSTRLGLAKKVRQLSNFGINLNRQNSMPVGLLASLGTNAKMSEFHAAVCLASFEKWNYLAGKRFELYSRLKNLINEASGYKFEWQEINDSNKNSAPSLLCARVFNSESRLAIETKFKERKIMSRRWYLPLLSEMPVLREHCVVLTTKNANLLSEDLLGFPFFLEMSIENEERILNVIKEVFR